MTLLYGVGNRRTGAVESWWWTREEAEVDAAEFIASDPDLAGALSLFAADLPGTDFSELGTPGRGRTWWLGHRYRRNFGYEERAA